MNIRVSGELAGKVTLNKIELDMFKVIQTRKSKHGDKFHCLKCSKFIPFGSFCFGSRNIKYCYECGKQVMKNFQTSMDKLKIEVNDLLKNAEDTEGEIQKNNMIAGLADEKGVEHI